MSTVKVTNLQHASSASPNIVLDSSGNATMAGTMAMATPFAMRNKIINGAMEIDQRNAGASVTIGATTGTYTLDRWGAQSINASKFSIQQSAGSVTPPAGFVNYLGLTSLAATSAGSTDYYSLYQPIEGLNVTDLAWGTASAKTVTVSFWIYSSLTGSFSGSLANSGAARSYPFSYTISSANTWEYKTVTIPGDTSGTWLTSNGIGVYIRFDLGCGSTFRGTANTWATANYYGVTSAVSVVGTNGATFYLTGVQLEVGSVATPFERRLYPQELAMCQRYYQIINNAQATGSPASSAVVFFQTTFPVAMRTAPTSVSTSTSIVFYQASSNSTFTGGGVGALNTATVGAVEFQVASYTGLTVGSWGLYRSSGTGQIAFSAEL